MTRAAFLSLLIVLSSPAQAYFGTDFLETKVAEAETMALTQGDDGVQRLRAFRSQVEQGAYALTLRLCEGYRRAEGLGPSTFHGQYMFTLNESLNAWMLIANQGLYQPLDATTGLKADYLALTHSKKLAFESWFRSLYAIYLIHSMGFLEGSMHCFETMDRAQINRFAATITLIDSAATLVTDETVTLSSELILARLLEVSAATWWWRWWPGRLQQAFAQRMANTKIAFSVLLVVPFSVGGLFAFFDSLERGRDSVTWSASEPKPVANYVTAAQLFYHDYDTQGADYADLKQWITSHIDNDMRKQASQDLETLQAMEHQQQLSPAGKSYLALLRTMVPIIEQFR